MVTNDYSISPDAIIAMVWTFLTIVLNCCLDLFSVSTMLCPTSKSDSITLTCAQVLRWSIWNILLLPLPWSVWLSQWSTMQSLYSCQWLHPSLPWLVNYSVWSAINRIIYSMFVTMVIMLLHNHHTFCVSVISKLSETFAISCNRWSSQVLLIQTLQE